MTKITRSNPKAFEILASALKDLDGREAEVGWFKTKHYPDKNSTPVAYVASIQEFGTTANGEGGAVIVIPPRPFMRPTIEREKNNWLEQLGKGAAKVLEGKTDAKTVLQLVIDKAATDISKTISQITTPPLKPATIAARLRKKADKKTLGLLDKPLEDTFELINSVEGRVTK